MRICLDDQNFSQRNNQKKSQTYTKTMLHAEFLCDVFCCDFLQICFSEPCSLTYLEVFIDILMIYIDYFGLKYMQCCNPLFFWASRQCVQFALFSVFSLVCLDQCYRQGAMFENLSFQISGKCLSGGFLLHFLHVISAVFFVIRLVVLVLTLSPVWPSFSRDRKFV